VIVAMQHVNAAMVMEIVQQVAAGLSHVHRSGVVHRDVRTANILLLSTTPLKVVLADFGVSCRITPTDARCCPCCRSSGAGSVSPTAPVRDAAYGRGHAKSQTTDGDRGDVAGEAKGVGCENVSAAEVAAAAAESGVADASASVASPLPLHVTEDDDDPRSVKWGRLLRRRNSMAVVGPVAWMAPEALSTTRSRGATFVSDVYMFGGLLFEMLTGGRRPYFWIESEHSCRVVDADTLLLHPDTGTCGLRGVLLLCFRCHGRHNGSPPPQAIVCRVRVERFEEPQCGRGCCCR
jgi:serine/threonine protein kinase